MRTAPPRALLALAPLRRRPPPDDRLARPARQDRARRAQALRSAPPAHRSSPRAPPTPRPPPRRTARCRPGPRSPTGQVFEPPCALHFSAPAMPLRTRRTARARAHPTAQEPASRASAPRGALSSDVRSGCASTSGSMPRAAPRATPPCTPASTRSGPTHMPGRAARAGSTPRACTGPAEEQPPPRPRPPFIGHHGRRVRQRERRTHPPAATQGSEAPEPFLLLLLAAALILAPASRHGQAHRVRGTPALVTVLGGAPGGSSRSCRCSPLAPSGGGEIHRPGEGKFTGTPNTPALLSAT